MCFSSFFFVFFAFYSNKNKRNYLAIAELFYSLSLSSYKRKLIVKWVSININFLLHVVPFFFINRI